MDHLLSRELKVKRVDGHIKFLKPILVDCVSFIYTVETQIIDLGLTAKDYENNLFVLYEI